MYRIIVFLFLFLPALSHSQSIILDKGFEELVLGITGKQVSEIIGFNGREISRQEYIDTELGQREQNDLPAFKLNFDKCIIYKHIMPVPVTKVYLKGNKVICIEISSFPSFSRPICLDSQTKEGLSFWDTGEKIEEIYGSDFRKVINGAADVIFYYYDAKGIGIGVSNNEVRIIEYY